MTSCTKTWTSLSPRAIRTKGGAGGFACAILLVAGIAQAQVDPTEALARARDKVHERADRLPNYTCVQTVDRQYFDINHRAPATVSCDDLAGEKRKKPRKLKLDLTDRLRLDVKVSAGNEIGSWAGSSHFESNVMDLVGGGPFGTGPFGTFASDIFGGVATTFHYLDQEQLNGVRLLHYEFQVREEGSHYQVQAGQNWHTTAYDGSLWIDPVSFDLKRLMVRTDELPPETGACEATTVVSYEETQIGDGRFLVPQRSELHFLLRDRSETTTTSSYSACRVYRSESTIKFDDAVPETGTIDKAPAPESRSLPPGLLVSLELSEPVDTQTAASGDVVRAIVRKSVRDKQSKEIVIPAGAVVRGRIIRLRHWLVEPRFFEIAVRFDRVEMNGAVYAFHAVRERTSPAAKRGFLAALQPPDSSTSVGTFRFVTTKERYVVPRGYESNWITY